MSIIQLFSIWNYDIHHSGSALAVIKTCQGLEMCGRKETMYNKDFFDSKFEHYNEIDSNAWRINWRASQLHRMKRVAEEINLIIRNHINIINILEIGCASADFTQMYYKKNDFFKR